MIWKLLAAALLTATLTVLAWPWVNPWLERRNQPQRLLDRIEEEWDREGDPPKTDWTNW